MHGLQTCFSKYITVAAFRIYAQRGEDAAKRMQALNSHGNYIVDQGKSWIFVYIYCGNPGPTVYSFFLPQSPDGAYSNIVTVTSSLDHAGLHQVTHKMKNLKTGGTRTLVNDTVNAQKIVTKLRSAN